MVATSNECSGFVGTGKSRKIEIVHFVDSLLVGERTNEPMNQ
jgi:hypothetical protein